MGLGKERWKRLVPKYLVALSAATAMVAFAATVPFALTVAEHAA
jgi:hypothetical protein